MKNIFLTGEIQIGKSTALRKIMETLDYEFGGYLGFSLYLKKDNRIKLIKAESLNNNEIYTLARINLKTRNIEVYKNVFEEKLALDIEASLIEKEVIILDEIGKFEENYHKFQASVYKALDSEKLVLGVLKKYDGKFINSIKSRKDTAVFEVNRNNRDDIPIKVLNFIKNKFI